jgi:antitoxin component HigA of HigAB toxin-antitoxin module
MGMASISEWKNTVLTLALSISTSASNAVENVRSLLDSYGLSARNYGSKVNLPRILGRAKSLKQRGG